VISLCDAASRELAADDEGRADIVVYTGLGAE
jgi:hypothetical protein